MPGADPAEYDIRLRLWLAARKEHGDSAGRAGLIQREPLDRSSSAYTIAESDVEAALAENARMREELTAATAESEKLNRRLTAQVRELRHAYRSGWDERGLVVARALQTATGGWSEAERRAKAYADDFVRDHAIANTATAPQQPERDTATTACVCGCGRPADDTDMCHCPTPCACEPDCAFCLVPNLMQQDPTGGTQ